MNKKYKMIKRTKSIAIYNIIMTTQNLAKLQNIILYQFKQNTLEVQMASTRFLQVSAIILLRYTPPTFFTTFFKVFLQCLFDIV